MRPTWDEFFLGVAQVYASMGTCKRLKVGAVIVKEKKQVGQGFNGSIHGHEHCIDEGVGCLINEEGRCIRTLHAEENAVLQTERHLLEGATMYVTHEPCEKCAKMIAQVGIKKIVFRNAYKNQWNKIFLKNIEVIHLPIK